MNKTVTINLGGLVFHIDENAFLKLQNYLNAVRHSFSGVSGEDEILSDIESRIAELFSQKITHDKQVITNKEVSDVIEIMGQPEDYMVDDDIFEETNNNAKTRTINSKNLYRDTDSKYIGGVASGLGHYFDINPIWIRLIFILSAQFGGVIAYIVLWALLPEAKTTSEKISMKGDPVTISNIEKKIKEGFDSASETVKNVDYQKYGHKAQSGISSFFDTLGTLFTGFFKIIGKFIGALFVITGTATIIGLLFGLLATGSIELFGFEFTEQLALYDHAGIFPYWTIAILVFFAVGIPFSLIAYLGLKILVSNLKSTNNATKLSLLGIWLLACISLVVLGFKTASKTKDQAHVIVKNELQITAKDTLFLSMHAHELYSLRMRRNDEPKFVYNESDEKLIYGQDIRLIVKSTKDEFANIRVKKTANGVTHDDAKNRAKDIEYSYTINNNTLILDNYLLMSPEQKYNNQSIEITLYLPEGSVLYADKNTYYYHRNSSYYGDILDNDDEEHFLQIKNDKTVCLDCAHKEITVINDDKGHVIINEDGINIKLNEQNEKGHISIGKNGINIDVHEGNESFNMNIDENGVRIKN